MWERYFVKPQTVDRVWASWNGQEIELYVECRDPWFRGQWPTASAGAVRRFGPGILRVSRLRAGSAAGVDPRLPAPLDSL